MVIEKYYSLKHEINKLLKRNFNFAEVFFMCFLVLSFFTVFFQVESFVNYYLLLGALIVGSFYLFRNFQALNEKKELPNDNNASTKFNLFLLFGLILILLLISLITSISLDKSLKGIFLFVLLVIYPYKFYLKFATFQFTKKIFKFMTWFGVLSSVVNLIFILGFAEVPSLIQQTVYIFGHSGLFSSYNILGVAIFLTLPAVIYLIVIESEQKYFMACVFLLLSLILTTSKASILSFGIFASLFSALYFKIKFKSAGKYLLTGIILSFVGLKIMPSTIVEKFRINRGLNTRDFFWQKGIEYIQTKPFFGSGFRTVYGVDLGGQVWNFHNLYIVMGVELGLIATGAILFLSVYFLTISTKQSLLIKDRKTQILAYVCISFLISMMVHQTFEQMLFFFSNIYFTNVYFIIYLATLSAILFKGEAFYKAS